MKTLLLITGILLFISCNTKPKYKYYDLGEMISDCDDYAVVVSIGQNTGNTKPYRNYILVKDSKGVCREYCGAKFDINKGDTLVIK